jgi:hypothetical protein
MKARNLGVRDGTKKARRRAATAPHYSDYLVTSRRHHDASNVAS